MVNSVRDRLIAWERLRLVYNGVMLLVGVPVAVSIYLSLRDLPEGAVDGIRIIKLPIKVVGASLVFGVAANACFLFGPLLEVYLTAFTNLSFGPTARKVLFGLGLAFSLGVEALVWLVFGFLAFAAMD